MKYFLKSLYKLIPFKQQIFSVIRLLNLSETITKHLYFDGQIDFKVGSKTIVMNQKGYDIENTLFWQGVNGGWEKVSIGIWMKLCENAQSILDIGANTGIYALIAKTINEKSDVFAFEPMDKIYNRLEANVKLNNLDIKSFHYALSNYNGTAKVYPESEEHVYSVTVNKNISGDKTKVYETEIVTKTLEYFIESNNIKKIDLMKIDVETHEPEVLEGMGLFLQKWKPDMIIEILNLEVAEKVQKITKPLGYLYFNIDENGGIEFCENLSKSNYYNFLICSEKSAKTLGLR